MKKFPFAITKLIFTAAGFKVTQVLIEIYAKKESNNYCTSPSASFFSSFGRYWFGAGKAVRNNLSDNPGF